MKKTHLLSNMWRKLQRKKPHAISTWHLILLLVFVFMVFVGLPILMVVAVAFPSATSPPVNWKIALPFLVLYIGWWLYALLRGVPARVAQLEAQLEAEKKPGTRKALQTPDQRASRGGTDAA